MQHEVVQEAAKAAPPVTVVGMTVFGIPLNEFVLLLTALYTALQIYVLVRDRIVIKDKGATWRQVKKYWANSIRSSRKLLLAGWLQAKQPQPTSMQLSRS